MVAQVLPMRGPLPDPLLVVVSSPVRVHSSDLEEKVGLWAFQRLRVAWSRSRAALLVCCQPVHSQVHQTGDLIDLRAAHLKEGLHPPHPKVALDLRMQAENLATPGPLAGRLEKEHSYLALPDLHFLLPHRFDFHYSHQPCPSRPSYPRNQLCPFGIDPAASALAIFPRGIGRSLNLE